MIEMKKNFTLKIKSKLLCKGVLSSSLFLQSLCDGIYTMIFIYMMKGIV